MCPLWDASEISARSYEICLQCFLKQKVLKIHFLLFVGKRNFYFHNLIFTAKYEFYSGHEFISSNLSVSRVIEAKNTVISQTHLYMCYLGMDIHACIILNKIGEWKICVSLYFWCLGSQQKANRIHYVYSKSTPTYKNTYILIMLHDRVIPKNIIFLYI